MNYKHGMCKTRIYKIYDNMKARCENPTSNRYNSYGARGIKCKWQTFQEFYIDMGPTYKKHLTIDRIDNDGDYCKENCKWSTYKEQANNRRDNVYLEHKGVKKSLMEWEKEVGICYKTLHGRISRGWSVERTLNITT